ncbi:hypothetical protein IT397_02560, partial [Candidatus Nomurabacteria bacterium]|nr:hypothetical protein [Candidatus Nomurabacteria bacterium]
MEEQIERSKKHNVFIIYVLSFIYALHSALPAYINSSFLNKFINEDWVGIVYTVSAILTLVTFITIPLILRKYG